MKTLRPGVSAFAGVALAAGCLLGAGIGSAQPITFTHLAGGVGGSGWFDGTGSGARFNGPGSVAVDGSGNVFVADRKSHTIRKVSSSGGVTTLAGLAGSSGSAGGTGSEARFYYPTGVAVDGAGNVYVADRGNHTIRKVSSSGGVTTFAGLAGSSGSADGTGSGARFDSPGGVAVDGAGNVYVSDQFNHTIRKVTSSGVVTTLAGRVRNNGYADGTGSEAQFSYPSGVAVDATGTVYVTDEYNHTIRRVTSSGVVTTLAGLAGNPGSTDEMGSWARFSYPSGAAVDGAGNVYVADQLNHTIRKVTSSGVVTTLAGLAGSWGSADGMGSGARFSSPRGVAVDGAGNVYVADESNHAIRKVTSSGVVTTLAGLAGSPGSADGTGSEARFCSPTGVAVDGSGNVYVADHYNHTIRKVASSGVVTTLAGLARSWGSADGTGSGARFYNPSGVAVDGSGNVYVADEYNHAIRKVTSSGVVTTLAGRPDSTGSADGTGNWARFYRPSGVTADGSGNVYVADYANQTIRKVTSSGVVTTLAGLAGSPGSADGTGSGARFYNPSGVAVDGLGNVYVADQFNDTLRKVTSSGVVTTPAGRAGITGSADGTGSGARFSSPRGVAIDGTGSVYVADTENDAIRKGAAGLSDTAVIDSSSGAVGYYRVLGAWPRTASSWLWEIVRRPSDSAAQLSSTTTSLPNFRPDRDGLFTFRLTARAANGQQSITTVDLTVTCGPVEPPVVSSSANPSCPGTPVTLDAGAGYTSYL